MSLPRLRISGLLLAACLGIWGCPDGQSSFIPPQATAAPGGSRVFVYAAEATNPSVGTLGGAVSAYELGADGLLPGGAPLSTVDVVNPRRLIVHAELDVLYVATPNQILAFDISSGALVSMCGAGAGLAPPCATNPSIGSDPVDMAVARNADGTFMLYVAETGSTTPSLVQSRISAYPLGTNGELPGFPTSQGRAFDTASYFGVSASPLYLWAADAPIQRINRFPREADGNLPYPAPTPSPINQPSPTPSASPTPGPTVTPTPSPVLFLVNFPGRIEVVSIPQPTPPEPPEALYAVEQGAQRIGAWIFDEFDDLPPNPNTETNQVGFYNSILLSPSRNRIYGAAFQVGRIDSWPIDSAGNIDASLQNSTFDNAAAYPTGLAWLEFTPSGGGTEQVVFGSFGGLDRIDGYRVLSDGALEQTPFTSTTPRQGTFPSDVAVNVLPPG